MSRTRSSTSTTDGCSGWRRANASRLCVSSAPRVAGRRDPLGQAAQGRVLAEPAGEHLGAAEDDGEQVVEVVRDAARELPEGLEALHVTEPLRHLARLGEVAEVDRQAVRVGEGRDLQVAADGGVLRLEADRLPVADGAFVLRLEDGPHGVGELLPHDAAHQALPAALEQRGGVVVHHRDPPLPVEAEHGVADALQGPGQPGRQLAGPALELAAVVDVDAASPPPDAFALLVVLGGGLGEVPAEGAVAAADPELDVVRRVVRDRVRPALPGELPVVGVQEPRPGVAEDLLRLDTGVLREPPAEVVDPAVRAGGPDEHRQGVRHRPEPLLALLGRDLGLACGP